MKDNFGQDIIAGAKAVYANKKPGRPSSLDICTIDKITDKGTVFLTMADGTRAKTTKESALCLVETVNKKPEVGDYVLAAVEIMRNQYVPYVCEVMKITDKKVAVHSLGEEYNKEDMMISYDRVVVITRIMANDLCSKYTTYSRECFEAWGKFMDDVAESGVKPFERKGNQLVWSDEAIKAAQK